MELPTKKARQQLSMGGLLSIARNQFDKVVIEKESERSSSALSDCLMSGLAIFSMKYPSLLSFDKAQDDPIIEHNIKTLFDVKNVPCDTYLRKRLDEVNPRLLRGAFKSIFTALQRGKALEDYTYLDNSYLISIDGTGTFSSSTVHCDQCNIKESKKTGTTYYHQMLNAVIVHPDKREVIPLCPEAILKADGQTKNDCERNAAKRLLQDLRREHPHLKITIIEDGLSSNGPHIRLLKELNMHYILGAKPDDHKFLYDWVATSTHVKTHETLDEKGVIRRYRYLNNVPLNDANFELEVNFLEYTEISPKGKTQKFAWVTDFVLSEHTVYTIMKGARARWKIENETFNTLKNQGYHYEHNFGHGSEYLHTVFAYLMMLAFLIDQVQQLCCAFFQAALLKMERKKYLWEKLRSLFFNFLIESWEQCYHAITQGLIATRLASTINSS